jgi:uncharacterized membrane protein YecN with MAPEG domain
MSTLVSPTVSALAAGALIVGQVGLALAVVGARRRAGQSLGEGGDPALLRAIRRHGNYAENAAIFVVCLALLEMLGAARWFVAALAALFIVGRVLHAIGLSRPATSNRWRVAGAVATALAGFGVGVRLVLLVAGQLLG